MSIILALLAVAGQDAGWKKHTVVEGGHPLTAVAADYTGDGKVDVIADIDGSVRLYVAPDWREVVLHDAEKIRLIHSETFDVDGDGDPDWIGVRYRPGLIFWLENPGGEAKGPWKRRLVDDRLHGSHALLKVDIDGDGKLDLMAGAGLPKERNPDFPQSLAWLRVPRNVKSAERWERYILADGNSPGLNHYFGAGDVNGDGRMDVCAGAKGSPPDRTDAQFAWWEAPKDPRKPWKKHLVEGNLPGATCMQPADVNGDGKMDFIATRGHEKGVMWYEAPGWKRHAIHADLQEPHSLVVADIDGDGDADAATCAFGAREAWWYESDGKGGFTHHLIAKNQSAYDIRAVDMNGDGRLDILIAGRDSKNVAWYENPGKKQGAAWPRVNGPFGNFNLRRYGHDLVDDLSKAKTVWTSEDRDLGYGKTSVSGFSGNRAKWPGHVGACSGLIAAEGKIFAASFRPSGEAVAINHPAARAFDRYSGEQLDRLRDNMRIEAEDLVVAIDMETGKTAWKVVEPGGLNRGMGKREGWGVTPAYHDGRVFALSTVGKLRAYDAATGKPDWETDIGEATRQWAEDRAEALEKKTLASSKQLCSLTVIGGVLIVPLFDKHTDIGLRGVEVTTGKTLWEVAQATARKATPAIWRHAGEEYVVVATHGDPNKRGNGKLRLIDPADGRVLWTVDGLENTHFALAPSDRTVLVNMGSREVGHGGRPWIRLAAYRLSLEGAERAWAMDDERAAWHEPRYEASDWRKYLIRDGKVYYYSRARTEDKKVVANFWILDEETGRVLYRESDATITRGQLYLLEDRLLQIPDASHSDRLTMRFWTDDPADFRPVGGEWKPPHEATTAYEVFMEFPYVDGRIYMRARDGSVRCYDLRR